MCKKHEYDIKCTTRVHADRTHDVPKIGVRTIHPKETPHDHSKKPMYFNSFALHVTVYVTM